MEGRLYFLVYIIFLAYVAQKDYYNHQYKQQHVHIAKWICSKTRKINSYQTKQWNTTLFTLPGIQIHLNGKHCLTEYLLSPDHIIEIPYSEEAKTLLGDDWKDKEDTLCFMMETPLSICNLFDGCLFWPLVAPLKPLGWLFISLIPN